METLHYRLPRRVSNSGIKKCTPVAAAALGKNMNQGIIGGRGLPDTFKHSDEECICIRCKVIVFCRSCGYFMNGRLRRKCPIHPRVCRIIFDVLLILIFYNFLCPYFTPNSELCIVGRLDSVCHYTMALFFSLGNWYI